MPDLPQRIQRQRTPGWRMPEGAVYVGRGSRWGNSWTRANSGGVHPAVRFACETVPLWKPGWQAELRSRDLACWCQLCPRHAAGRPFGANCNDCEPCHGDVLGEVANA